MERGPGIDDADDQAPLVEADPSQLAGMHGHPSEAVPDTSAGEDHDVRHPEVVVRLGGQDGNAYALLGTVQRALRKAGPADQATACFAEATSGDDHHHLLQTRRRWVTVR